MRRFPVDEPPGPADDSTDQREGHTFERGSDDIFVRGEEDDELHEESEQQSKHHSFA